MGAGDRIRILRRRRGLTQAVLAQLVGHSERWLRDVEAGAVDLWLSDALRLAEALHVDITDLLHDSGVRSSGRVASDLHRRRQVVDRPSPAAAGRQSEYADDVRRMIEASALPDRERLNAALDGKDSIDDQLIESLSALGRAVPGVWGRLPPSRFRRLAHAHLETLHALMAHPMPSSFRRELESAAACTAAVAGNASMLTGQPQDAAVYLRLAEQLARDAGDVESEAMALVYSSRLLSRVCPGGPTADPARAIEVLEAADHRLGQYTAPVPRAQLLMRWAEELAWAGRGTTANRLADEADRLVEGAGGMPVDGLCTRWSKDLHVAFRGQIAVLSGRPADGIPLLESALAALPPEMVATKTMATADLGGAYARQGEIDHACQLLRVAIAIAVDSDLPGPLLRIRRIRAEQLGVHSKDPAVRRLDDALAAMAC